MAEKCSTNCLNEEAVTENRKIIDNHKGLMDTAEFFKLFANTTRLKILLILLGNGVSDSARLCVCDIAESIQLSIPATSQQLKMLRKAGILDFRNRGKTVYYIFSSPEIRSHVQEVLKLGNLELNYSSLENTSGP